MKNNAQNRKLFDTNICSTIKLRKVGIKIFKNKFLCVKCAKANKVRTIRKIRFLQPM